MDGPPENGGNRAAAEAVTAGVSALDRLADSTSEPSASSDGAVVAGSASRVSEDSFESMLRALGQVPELYVADGAARGPRTGDRVGRFELVRELGAGGFGVVFEAVDSELGRRVALKFLRVRLEHSAAPGRFVELMRREAATAARLNHPNIVTLFDVGSWQGLPYLVMELADGETLQQRLARGVLSWQEALRLLLAVSEALAHAHRAGVVHRDLKPGNVLVGDGGAAKLLDLGLARVVGAYEELRADVPEPRTDNPESHTSFLSGAGTPGYLAPEQWLRGEQTARVDVWAAGVVLYEALTGALPFGKALPAQAVLAVLPPEVPRPLQRVLEKALASDPAQRYEDGGALLAALQAAQGELEASRVAEPRAGWRRTRWGLAGLVAVAVVAVVVTLARPEAEEAPAAVPMPARNAPPPEHRQFTFSGKTTYPSISPDGTRLVYIEGQTLYLVTLPDGAPRKLYEGRQLGLPRWSPDSQRLLFQEWDDTHSALRLCELPACLARTLPVPPVDQFVWSPDGSKIAGVSTAERSLSVFGLDGTVVARRGFEARVDGLSSIDWSATDGRLVYANREAEVSVLGLVSPDLRDERVLLRTADFIREVRWAPKRGLVYFLAERGGVADVRALDVAAPAGTVPRSVLSGLPIGLRFELSADGRLLSYTRETAFSKLVAFSRASEDSGAALVERSLQSDTAYAGEPSLSPDGRWVIYAVGQLPRSELRLVPFAGGLERTLPTEAGYHASPVFSPDGREVAWGFVAPGAPAALQLHTLATSVTRTLALPGALFADPFMLDWSPGPELVFVGEGMRSLEAVGAQGTRPLVAPKAARWVFEPRYSSSGKQLAYLQNQASGYGCWIRPVAGGAPRLLRRGLFSPIAWSADDSVLYLGRIDTASRGVLREIERVDVKTGKTLGPLRFSPPRALTSLRMSRDGKHFVGAVREERSDVWVVEHFDPLGP